MVSIKSIFLILFMINLLSLLLIGVSQYKSPSQPDFLSSPSYLITQEEHSNKSTYAFDNPQIAYKLLGQLDIFEVVEIGALTGANYSRTAGGFAINDKYCEDHRLHFVYNPGILFDEVNVVTNYWPTHKFRRQVLPSIGAKDLHKEVYPKPANKIPQYKYDMNPSATVFFMHDLFFYSKQIGKQFSCLSQASNHIPGHDLIYRKDFGAQALVDYAKTYQTRPACFNYDQFFPKTWVLQQKEQCEDFFREFNSDNYQTLKEERNVVYFRKIGADVHEGKGVFPVTDSEESSLRKLYNNGKLCGKIQKNYLIQYNVYNPLLLENRKFGFRMFLLIASTNPVIAYFHDGYLRLSIDQYNASSKDIRTFVTNIGVNLKEAQKEDAFQGMSEEQIQEYTVWYFDQFNQYLNKKGIIKDRNWVNAYLRPQFKKVMIHLIRMSQSAFFKKSSVFELYGLDFVMDDNLGLWYIETNTMPLISGFTKESTKQFNQMLTSAFEITMGLVRSRMKRVTLFINKLTREVSDDGKIETSDLERRREEFRQITMNRFEPEFEPRKNNTFQLIINENKEGVDRYMGLIRKECL